MTSGIAKEPNAAPRSSSWKARSQQAFAHSLISSSRPAAIRLFAARAEKSSAGPRNPIGVCLVQRRSASRSRKIAEIGLSTPGDMAHNSNELFAAMSEAGRAVANRATEMGRGMGDAAVKATSKTADMAKSAAESAGRR